MKTKKPKLNRKQRSALRKAKIAAGTYVAPPKPAAKKKRKIVSCAGRTKLKAPTPAAGARPPAQPQPELEAIPLRPRFVAPRHFFTGGGIAKAAGFVPDGFVLASQQPGADYRIAEFRTFRTFPEGESVRCVRYVLKPAIVAHMRAHAESVRKEIAIDDGNAIARKDLALLVAKNRRNGQPTRLFYK